MRRILLFVLLGMVALLAACNVARPDAETTTPTQPVDPQDLPTATVEPTEEGGVGAGDGGEGTPVGGGAAGETPMPVDAVTLYFVALDDGGAQGEGIGCGDSLVGIPASPEVAPEPIEGALAALVDADPALYEDQGLYNALAESNLTLDEVVVDQAVTTVALSGDLVIGGVCDEPRVQAQIEATARQFFDVSEVRIIVNGDPLSVVFGQEPPPDVTPENPQANTAEIYLIALEDAGESGTLIGCQDSAVRVTVDIEPDGDPLVEALQALLLRGDDIAAENDLYNGLQNSELTVAEASVFDDGTASVALAGYVEVGGECDLPRIAAQLELTVLQFPEVEAVDITINDQPLDVVVGNSGLEPTEAEVYLVALEDAGEQGEEIGCGDSVVAVERMINPAADPLQAALEELLSIDTDFYLNTGFYNALYQSDLSLASLELGDDGTAYVDLTGDLMLGGTCDSPRVEAQIEQTALQFDDVTGVEVTLDGEPLADVLSQQ